MWPEFIRKLTILLLYDRLNSSNFQPASWKPGPWYQSSTNESVSTASDHSNNKHKKHALDPIKFNPNIARISTAKRNLFPDESSKQVTETNSLFDVSLIMSQNMSLESFKPYESTDFGSHQYMIRSKQFHSNQTHAHHAHNHYKHEILQSEDEDENLNRFPKLEFNHKLKTKRKKPIQVKEMSTNLNNWIEKSAIERLTDTESKNF